MIIANRLVDGVVVFFAAGDAWVADIDAGLAMDDQPEADKALAIAKRHEADSIVIDPQLIEITVEDGRKRPVAIREAIRAFGPTIRTDRDGAGGGNE